MAQDNDVAPILFDKTSIVFSKNAIEKAFVDFEAYIDEQEVLLTEQWGKWHTDLTTMIQREINVHERETNVGEREVKLEKMKHAISKVYGTDVVNLNVGGEVVSVLRQTLTSVPGSMLEAMFSGRHAELKGKACV
jgi:hypothetical protein